MHIPMPIGTKRVAAVNGSVWKFVCCARCQERYAYLLKVEATGEDHDLLFLDGKGSAERARAQAEQHFAQKCRNVVLAIPCPGCGFYQDDMARKLKEAALCNPLQIAGVVIVLLSLVPLALDIDDLWVPSVIIAVIGLALVAWGMMRASRFDANAGDPEPRKALGRAHAVWGERLAELLATNPNADPVAGSHQAFHG